MKKQKIILVSNALWTMVKFRKGLIKELIERGYSVYIISPNDNYYEEIKSWDCNYLDIKMDNKGSNPINDIKFLYKLYSIYKQIQPDLILHYTIKPNIYGSFASKLSGYKSMSIIPGLGYTFINENITAKIAKLLYKIALKIPKRVWFINEDDKNVFLDYHLVESNKVDTINSEGINTKLFAPVESKTESAQIVFLMIGRILKDKGVYEYVESAKIIKQKYNNVKFQLLGPIYTLNPASIGLKEVKKWHDDNIIEYIGETKDVRSYISDCDCVVLPSYREGKGMTLVEGASMGKPLIATDVPGCRDVVSDGSNGYLCEVRNANDLSIKMEKILSLTDEERKTMGLNGRKKVLEEFDETVIINKYLKTIREILE